MKHQSVLALLGLVFCCSLQASDLRLERIEADSIRVIHAKQATASAKSAFTASSATAQLDSRSTLLALELHDVQLPLNEHQQALMERATYYPERKTLTTARLTLRGAAASRNSEGESTR